MTRSRRPQADDVHRTALRRRVARLKVAAWAAAAGAGLAFWSLVGGSVGATTATTATPALPAASGQESGSTDLFGNGSTLGVGSSPPVLRSHGS
jgi:hypothetical protein